MSDEAKIGTVEAFRFTTVNVDDVDRIAFLFQAQIRDKDGVRPFSYILDDEDGPYFVVADHDRRFKLRLEEIS